MSRRKIDRTALDRLPTHPGLCATCRHLRLLASPRSVFVRCARAKVDPGYVRYPRLPVLACPGHEPEAAQERGGG